MLLIEYLYWHFAIAPRKILEIAANYMTATWHRFLIVQHLGSLFAPWHRRLPSDFGKTKSVGDRVTNVITDIYIRFFAACIRMTIVLSGLFVEVVLFFLTFLLFFAWVLWPLVAIAMIGKGISLL